MKIVKEHINEKFTQESDPIKDLGIGKINLYEMYLKFVPEEHRNINNQHLHKKWLNYLKETFKGRTIEFKHGIYGDQVVVKKIIDVTIHKPEQVFFHFYENRKCNWAVDLKYPITFIK